MRTDAALAARCRFPLGLLGVLDPGLEGGVDELHDEPLPRFWQALDALDLLQELGLRAALAGG